MIKKIKITTLICAITMLSTSNAFAIFGSGIVFDPTSYAKNALSYTKQLQQYKKQLQQYVTQVEQFNMQELMQEMSGKLEDTLDFKIGFLEDLDKTTKKSTNIFDGILGKANGTFEEKYVADETIKFFEMMLNKGEGSTELAKEKAKVTGNLSTGGFANGIAKSIAATTMIDSENKKKMLDTIDEKSAEAKTTGQSDVIRNKVGTETLKTLVQGNQLKAADMSDLAEKRAEFTSQKRQTQLGSGMSQINKYIE